MLGLAKPRPPFDAAHQRLRSAVRGRPRLNPLPIPRDDIGPPNADVRPVVGFYCAVNIDRPRRVGWGVLSTGQIASKFATDLALLPDEASLVAVSSRSVERAQDFAARHGFARAYGSADELAADPGVDVVYVASIHNDHFASARTCLAAGKAVLVEKPLTTSAAETETDRAGRGERPVPDGGGLDARPSAHPQGRRGRGLRRAGCGPPRVRGVRLRSRRSGFTSTA